MKTILLWVHATCIHRFPKCLQKKYCSPNSKIPPFILERGIHFGEVRGTVLLLYHIRYKVLMGEVSWISRLQSELQNFPY